MVLDRKHIDQLLNRDENLFNNIYEQTKKGIYSIIFSVVKNHDATQDLMQDVYMKMLIKIEQYKTGSNFFNWLAQIAKNQAIDHYRRESKTIDGTEMLKHIPTDNENPDELDEFNRWMGLLEDDESMIVMLRIVDDMKFKDIAKSVKKPLGTVLWIYQKAMDKLKKEMEV